MKKAEGAKWLRQMLSRFTFVFLATQMLVASCTTRELAYPCARVLHPPGWRLYELDAVQIAVEAAKRRGIDLDKYPHHTVRCEIESNGRDKTWWISLIGE